MNWLRILWHEMKCPAAAPTAIVRFSGMGRIYSCGCGFEVFDVWKKESA